LRHFIDATTTTTTSRKVARVMIGIESSLTIEASQPTSIAATKKRKPVYLMNAIFDFCFIIILLFFASSKRARALQQASSNNNNSENANF